MKKIRLDVLAVPLSGHLYPVMDLVAPLLQDERYDIRLFTGPQKAAIARQAGFQVVTFLPDQAERMNQVANSDAKLTLLSAFHQLADSLDLLNDLSDFLLAEWESNRPDIVVADFITLSGGLVCQQLGIPWITSMATQFAIESTEGPPCFFGGWGNEDNWWIQARNHMGRKLTRGAKRIVSFLLRKKVARYQFSLYNDKGDESIYSSYSILALGMKEVELKSGFPQQLIWAGPCCNSFEEPQREHFQLETIQKKKVLITCGTQLEWGKEQLVTIGKDLATHYLDYHFIVTLGNSQKMKEAPLHLMDNLTLVHYLPYSYYIQQMDYVIHHGGAGVFYNCIREAKPALILPHDYDQADYAIRGLAAGIALVADRDKLATIRQQFHRLTQEANWPALEELTARYRHYQPTQTLVAEIQRILGGH